jgi:general stress protein YciG
METAPSNKQAKGDLTVSEAGRRGGETTSQRYGQAFYQRVGKMGGQRVKELIEAGKKAEAAE